MTATDRRPPRRRRPDSGPQRRRFAALAVLPADGSTDAHSAMTTGEVAEAMRVRELDRLAGDWRRAPGDHCYALATLRKLERDGAVVRVQAQPGATLRWRLALPPLVTTTEARQ
jgi:hypothetical protein